MMTCILCGKPDCCAYDTAIIGEAAPDPDTGLVCFHAIPCRVGLCDEHAETFRTMDVDIRDALLKSRMDAT